MSDKPPISTRILLLSYLNVKLSEASNAVSQNPNDEFAKATLRLHERFLEWVQTTPDQTKP